MERLGGDENGRREMESGGGFAAAVPISLSLSQKLAWTLTTTKLATKAPQLMMK